jgi:hypothetical protein
VEAEKVKDPPKLAGDPNLSPSLLKVGAVAVLSFEANHELAETPAVTVKLSGVSRIMTHDAKTSSGLKYVYTYTAAGDEPQNTESPVTIQMVDKFGSQSGVISAGSLRFDFVTPKMTDAVVSGSPATAGKTVAVEFNVSKALKNDPVVAFDDVVDRMDRPAPFRIFVD